MSSSLAALPPAAMVGEWARERVVSNSLQRSGGLMGETAGLLAFRSLYTSIFMMLPRRPEPTQAEEKGPQ